MVCLFIQKEIRGEVKEGSDGKGCRWLGLGCKPTSIGEGREMGREIECRSDYKSQINTRNKF